MQDEIDGIVDDERLGDVMLNEPEPVVPVQVSQVPGRPRQQVVHAHDAPAVRQEMIAEVRTEKSRRSRD